MRAAAMLCGKKIHKDNTRKGDVKTFCWVTQTELSFNTPLLPWWLRWETICLKCWRPGFDPWVRKIPWRRKWLPTPVFLPGEVHGHPLPCLAGYSPQVSKESDMTGQLSLTHSSARFQERWGIFHSFFFLLRCCTSVSFMTSLRRTLILKIPDLILLKRTLHPPSAFAEHPPTPPSSDDIWISLCMVPGQKVIVKFFTSS